MTGAMVQTTTLQVLFFLLQDIRFCVNLNDVNKILPLPLLETVPGAPNFFAGLLNMGGQSVPVIDLAIRLGLTRTQPYSLDTPILLCAGQHKTGGIIIDKVLNLTDLPAKHLQMHSDFTNPASPFIAAVEYHNELSLLINTSTILAFDLTAEKNDLVVAGPLRQLSEQKHEKS